MNLIAALLLTACGSSEAPDLIFHNAKVFTASGETDAHYHQAFFRIDREVMQFGDGPPDPSLDEVLDSLRSVAARARVVQTALALGVVVVENPLHFALAGLFDQRIAKAERSGWQLMRSLVRDGVPLAIGSDGPANPFLNIMFAVLHPANPAEALSVEEAVIAYTRGSSYAQFAESDRGSLEPGKLADLVVLSRDIFDIQPDQLPITTSLLTLVGGRVVHSAPPFDM
jgi:hypothetical protein